MALLETENIDWITCRNIDPCPQVSLHMLMRS